MGKTCALLRAGFPYVKTLGMRRVTNFPLDLAIDRDDTLYVLCRSVGSAQIARVTYEDENLGPIGGFGTDDGKFDQPAAIILDRDENLFVSDEGLDRITILAKTGEFLEKWGESGEAPGKLSRPSGIAFDREGNLLVVDTLNHRVQRFTRDGTFLQAWGSHGSGPGELDMPWGIAVDDEGDVYVADWRNDRVQKFSPDGQYLQTFGRTGRCQGELSRPTGVAVDHDGDVYVADRGNDRVQQFDATGRYVETFIGDATLSKSGREYMLTNARPNRLREMADLEPQKRLRSPSSVRIDEKGRLFIADYWSYRVQVYQKDVIHLAPDQIVPPLRSPSLETT